MEPEAIFIAIISGFFGSLFTVVLNVAYSNKKHKANIIRHDIQILIDEISKLLGKIEKLRMDESKVKNDPNMFGEIILSVKKIELINYKKDKDLISICSDLDKMIRAADKADIESNYLSIEKNVIDKSRKAIEKLEQKMTETLSFF